MQTLKVSYYFLYMLLIVTILSTAVITVENNLDPDCIKEETKL